MVYTVEELIKLDTKIFGTMKPDELMELKEILSIARKERMIAHVKPVEKQHVKPVQDRYIKPLKDEHIKPVDKVLKALKTYLPKQKAKKAFITINGNRYGPLTKKEFMEMITEVDDEEEQ